ncbi:MAG: enoyl-CoA hydratase-related protein [Sphingobium sp.]
MNDIVQIENHGGVRLIALNRPAARNALCTELVLKLRKLIQAAGEDRSARCVVITGRGGAFSSGADLDEWDQINKGTQRYPDHDWVEEALKLIQDVAACPKPVIAMIDGAAVGAGLDLALACDFRYVSERSKFMCAYTHIGFSPDCGGTYFLPRLIGIEAAKRFVFTGETWTAQDALRLGLVSEVASSEELQARTMAFAEQLANGPTVAIGLARHLIDASFDRTLGEQLAAEQAAGKVCVKTRDHVEALAAAQQRRKPVFTGA